MGKYLSFVGSLVALFWSGSFVFGYPGVMGSYWKELLQVGSGEVGNTLFILLATVGVFMFFVGRWQEKYGFRLMITLGILICSTSLFIVSFPTSIEIIYLWAFVSGIQSSLIYIPAVTVAQLLFPESKGLVSGAATLVFGISAAIMSPVFLYMFNLLGYIAMNAYLAFLVLATGLLFCIFIQSPRVEKGDADLPSLTVGESLRTSSFWFLWFVWALQGAAGISMVTLSVPLGLAKGLGAASVFVLASFNFTNGASRLLSGLISDHFGRNNIMSVSFFIAGISYFLLTSQLSPVLIYLLSALIGYAFGTLFAVSAPLASDCFGLKHFGAIFGLIFTAYGFIAGLIGPSLSGHILDLTGDFRLILTYLGTLCMISSVLVLRVKPRKT
jgi:OFA family oxalate/formate antiporter-like MFS transporter